MREGILIYSSMEDHVATWYTCGKRLLPLLPAPFRELHSTAMKNKLNCSRIQYHHVLPSKMCMWMNQQKVTMMILYVVHFFSRNAMTETYIQPRFNVCIASVDIIIIMVYVNMKTKWRRGRDRVGLCPLDVHRLQALTVGRTSATEVPGTSVSHQMQMNSIFERCCQQQCYCVCINPNNYF